MQRDTIKMLTGVTVGKISDRMVLLRNLHRMMLTSVGQLLFTISSVCTLVVAKPWYIIGSICISACQLYREFVSVTETDLRGSLSRVHKLSANSTNISCRPNLGSNEFFLVLVDQCQHSGAFTFEERLSDQTHMVLNFRAQNVMSSSGI